MVDSQSQGQPDCSQSIRSRAQLMIQQVQAVEQASRSAKDRGGSILPRSYNHTDVSYALPNMMDTVFLSTTTDTASVTEDSRTRTSYDWTEDGGCSASMMSALADDLSSQEEDDSENDEASTTSESEAEPVDTGTDLPFRCAMARHCRTMVAPPLSSITTSTRSVSEPSSFAAQQQEQEKDDEIARLRHAVRACRVAVHQVQENAHIKVTKYQLEIASLKRQLAFLSSSHRKTRDLDDPSGKDAQTNDCEHSQRMQRENAHLSAQVSQPQQPKEHSVTQHGNKYSSLSRQESCCNHRLPPSTQKTVTSTITRTPDKTATKKTAKRTPPAKSSLLQRTARQLFFGQLAKTPSRMTKAAPTVVSSPSSLTDTSSCSQD